MALNSWAFLLLAGLAVFFLPLTRGSVKAGLFLTLNVVFVTSYWPPAGIAIAVGFCTLGYLCARWVRIRGTGSLAASIMALTVLFIYIRGFRATGLALGSATTPALIGIAGLSFLFFKVIHVVIDSASGTIEAMPPERYFNYCLNFTTVLMGPIQRYQDFCRQWTGEAPAMAPTFEAHLDATNRVLRGMVKAFVIAPHLQPYILRRGLPIDRMAAGDLFVMVYAFYVFLYFDFSGYCDIVIGIGSLMGIRPPENFYIPFLSRNVSAYWLRVHRSLTLWLTDYIFTPSYTFAIRSATLGSRPFLALAASLILTMLIAGAWHGTTPNFIAFGLVHGIGLVLVRGYESVMVQWLGRRRFRVFTAHPVTSTFAVMLTYNFTSLAYTFFVLDVHESIRVFRRLTLALGWMR
jgi:D-alanyl-lipoteichoic acid acyltransferase DltB (MBOAT superfamily)